ncbi:hypothetical protein DSO57_1035664 [Entomophthora muscae]|nr:hypothetical protein DSO57_1035664 [Entomophthora muscae]
MNLAKSRIKKLKEQYQLTPSKFDEPFNAVHLEVDRILDEGEISDPNSTDGFVVYVLVKWVGLAYDLSTWEKVSKVEELDMEKLEEFYARQRMPTDIPPSKVERPKVEQFVKLVESPAFKGGNLLRDYQLEGLNWFLYCYHHRRSCIMADEMGLGKTVQSVSFLHQTYYKCGVRGPFIIVAPLSTIPHWEREFRGWTDLNTIVFHGNHTSRNLIVETEFYYKDSNGDPITNRFKFDVLITTYEMLISGLSLLKPISWRVAVFDEAHRLKNRNSKALETLKLYKLEHRVLLTGTPLQNSVTELFSLLNFLDCERFPSEADFLKEFGDLKTSAEVTELQEILKPLMLRRFKEDVEKSIPDKEETVIEVELTRVQKGWYRAILERNFSWIQRGGGRAGEGPSLNNIVMELRKCCNHPFLIDSAEDKILQEQNVVSSEDYTRVLVEASGKLVLLDKLLPKLKSNGHKVLIFSQMTRVLDLLAEYLARCNYGVERIDGRVKSTDRQIAIDRYSTSPDSFVFLLCTRAGGVGINLTAADTVVIFDSDWNPQNDLQAQARAHRIGQTRPVKIYRLLCANTYERQMFDRANLKLGLDKAVMQKMTSSETAGPGLTKKEVEELLKLGAYGALLDDDESNKFCAEDIDHILERRSVVVQHKGNQKGTAFSKASFSTFDNDTTDLNDPDFWNKWADKANIDTTEAVFSNPLIIDHPRERRKAARFEQIVVKEPSEDGIDSIYEEDEEEPESDDVSEPEIIEKRIWRTSERTALERSLMIYALNDWESVQLSNPKRSVKDVRAAGLQLVLWHLSFPDAIQAVAGIDAPQLEADLKAALAAEHRRNDAGEEIDWPKLLLEDKIPYPDATEQQIQEFRSFLNADYIERNPRKPKALLLRIQTMYRICELMVPNDGPCIPPVARSSNNPAPWWTETHDRDLLIGIKRHGYLQYAQIRTDPDLCFSELVFDENVEGAVAWPPGVEIGSRLRRLIITFNRDLSRPDAPKPTSIPDRVDSWFPKAVKRFLVCMSSYGLQTTSADLSSRVWDQFRLLSELRQRSDSSLETLLHCIVSSYMGVLESSEGWEVRKRNEDVVEFGHQLLKTLTPAKVMPSLRLETPTPEKAKRLIKRIMLIHAFRQLLNEAPSLSALVNTCGRINGFPAWWDSKTHGVIFAHAISTYGIGGYDFIIRDGSMPFGHVSEENWPKDMYIVKFIERLLALNTANIHRARAIVHPSTPISFMVVDSAQGPAMVASSSSGGLPAVSSHPETPTLKRRGRKRLMRSSPASNIFRHVSMDLSSRPRLPPVQLHASSTAPYHRAPVPSTVSHPRQSTLSHEVLARNANFSSARDQRAPMGRKSTARIRHAFVPQQARAPSPTTSPTTDTASPPNVVTTLADLSDSSSNLTSPIQSGNMAPANSVSSLSSLATSPIRPPINGVGSLSSPFSESSLSPLPRND